MSVKKKKTVQVPFLYDGYSHLPEDTYLYASDLSMLKDEAKQLKKGIHPYAKEIEKQADDSKNTFFCARAQRLEAISQFYGYSSFSEIYKRRKGLLEYHNHNRRSGNWLRGPQIQEWDRNVFTKQYAALVNSVFKKIPVSQAAETLGVNFEGFHFSELLLNKISKDSTHSNIPLFDFSNLHATGCYIDASWLTSITTLKEAHLAYAKFYNIDDEGLIYPGFSYWKLDARKANLTGADLRRAFLRDSNFKQAKLVRTDFRNANIFGCSFEGSEGKGILGKENPDVVSSWNIRTRC